MGLFDKQKSNGASSSAEIKPASSSTLSSQEGGLNRVAAGSFKGAKITFSGNCLQVEADPNSVLRISKTSIVTLRRLPKSRIDGAEAVYVLSDNMDSVLELSPAHASKLFALGFVEYGSNGNPVISEYLALPPLELTQEESERIAREKDEIHTDPSPASIAWDKYLKENALYAGGEPHYPCQLR